MKLSTLLAAGVVFAGATVNTSMVLAQAAQPAGCILKLPLRRKPRSAATGDWKVARTRRLESLRHL